MKNQFYFLLFLIIITTLSSYSQTERGVTNKSVSNQSSEKRLALVIGNGNYQFTDKLPNPINDANDVATTLKQLGFEVISGTNTTLPQMRKLIRDFGTKLAQQKGVGLVYYAGHGIQVNGKNYLIPIDANIETEIETQDFAVDTDTLLRFMRDARNEFNIMILDACRNNPFARGWRTMNPNRDFGNDQGLARISPPSGTIILYSTEPGNVASDGAGRNGLFTESLLVQMKKPNVEFDSMVKLLARDVKSKSGGKQSPWKEGLYDGEFFFKQDAVSQTQPTIPRENPSIFPTPKPVTEANVEDIYWGDVSSRNTKSAYQLYLSEYPNGKYASLAHQKIDNFNREETRKQKEIETNKWDEAVSLNRKSSYQAYLSQYPNGEYSTTARNKIKEFETEEIRISVEQQNAKDKAGWEEAERIKTIISYEDYLKKFPNGKYVSLARLRLNDLGKTVNTNQPISTTQTNVPLPSSQTRQYNAGNIITANIPANWKEIPNSQKPEVGFAPAGAYGDKGISHGAILGVTKGTGNFQQDTQNFVNSFAQSNGYKKQGNDINGLISGRTAVKVLLAGQSKIYNRTEYATVYTTQTSDGSLLYLITIVPQNESLNYEGAFSKLVNSIRLNDNDNDNTNNKVQPKEVLKKFKVKVFADNTITNTLFVAEHGQTIRIKASGKVSLGKGLTSTPSGISSLPDSEKLLKNEATGGLIAVIGDDNNDFIFLGKELEFTAGHDGFLFLGINEGNLKDNSGYYEVEIEILK